MQALMRWTGPALGAGLAAAGIMIAIGLAGTRTETGIAATDQVAAAGLEAGEQLELIAHAGKLNPDEVLGLLMEEQL